jgi:DNA-binding response OmpR family regulator
MVGDEAPRGRAVSSPPGRIDDTGHPASHVNRPGDQPTHRPVILVVDDEVSIGDLVEVVLAEEGFEVVRAFDGRQAWSIIESRHVDLVLSDVMMPVASGLDLLRQVRSSHHRTLPVILMSAVYQVATSEAASLPKPFDLDDLVSIVREHTGRRSGDA